MKAKTPYPFSEGVQAMLSKEQSRLAEIEISSHVIEDTVANSSSLRMLYGFHINPTMREGDVAIISTSGTVQVANYRVGWRSILGGRQAALTTAAEALVFDRADLMAKIHQEVGFDLDEAGVPTMLVRREVRIPFSPARIHSCGDWVAISDKLKFAILGELDLAAEERRPFPVMPTLVTTPDWLTFEDCGCGGWALPDEWHERGIAWFTDQLGETAQALEPTTETAD